jgi:excinuclease UvrABC helicase subunit UvrB
MKAFKMTGELYEDVKIVHDAILYLHSMIETLEKECMIRDEGKVATELFIRINSMKREMDKIVADYELI